MKPNQDNYIVNELIKKCFANPNIKEEGLVSSHWLFYSDRVQLGFNDKGDLISLKSEGFGNPTWNSIRACVLDLFCILTHLLHLKRRISIIKLYIKVCFLCKRMGLSPTLDAFRQVCSLVILSEHITKRLTSRPLNFLIIGDGYGILSCLIAHRFPGCTLTLVDIGKTLLFQAYYCQRAYPNFRHNLLGTPLPISLEAFNYCASEDMSILRSFEFDIAINIASMQEMNQQTISKYFRLLRDVMRNDNLFYCSNRISKLLVGGEHIKYDEYPWIANDVHLKDEICPWHRYFFSSTSVSVTGTNFRFQIPAIKRYDGLSRHRVTVLSTNM